MAKSKSLKIGHHSISIIKNVSTNLWFLFINNRLFFSNVQLNEIFSELKRLKERAGS